MAFDVNVQIRANRKKFVEGMNRVKHQLHMFMYDVWDLLEIAESTNAPYEQAADSPNWCGDVLFDAKDGWKVSIFYDCGGLDYIESFINPKGIVIDFWEWPGDCHDHEADDFNNAKNILINWRGIGDLKRLKELEGK